MNKTITFKREDYYTIHDVSKIIVGLDKDAPDYEFRVQAAIKKLIHHEKLSVYLRMLLNAKLGIKFVLERVNYGIETHRKMKDLPDEEIITWSIANHKYKG